MSNYRVVFTGEFKQKIGRDQCIRNLAEKMGQDEETIARRFFDNPPCTILKTSNKSEARRAVKLFARAGAVLDIETLPAASKAGSSPTNETRETGRSGSRLPWLVASAVVLLALVAGGAWYTKPLWHTTEQAGLQEAEAAFATEDLLALGYLDVRRSVAIEQRFLGEQDADALPGGDTLDFVDQLMQQGLSPRETVDSVLLAVYATAGESRPDIRGAAMVTGRFDPMAVRAFINHRYQLEPGDEGSNLARFTMLDEQTCEQSEVIAVYMASDRLVVAPESKIRTLLTRLGASAGAERDLTQWRSFRSGRLASVGLLSPSKALAASGGMARMMLGEHQASLADIDALFLGLDASAMPPGVRMTAAASSPDSARQQGREADARNMLASAAERLEGLSPDAANLLGHVEVFRNNNQVGATLSLNDQFMTDLQTLATAGIEAMFQPFGVAAGSSGSGAPVGEQVDENPRVFRDRFDPASIPPFDDIDHNNDDLAWQQGPFALRVTEMGRSAKADSQPYITLQLEARELQNVPDNGTWGQLRITQVRDRQGNQVMPMPECGPDRNQEPSWLEKTFGASYFDNGEIVNYRKHVAEKRIHLDPGVSPQLIGEVQGVVEARIPVRVSRHRVEAPLAGKFVEVNGARVAFSADRDGQLVYETSGDHEAILAVRPLNARGQVLKSPGGTTMGRLLGPGRYHQRDVQGTPAQAEVVIAEQWQPLRHEFRLQEPFPVLTGSGSSMPVVQAAEPGAIQQGLNQPVPPEASEFFQEPMGYVDSGPLKVILQRLQSGGFYPFLATVDIRTALIPGLDHNLSAGRVALTSVTDDQGREHKVSVSAPFALKQDGMIINGRFQKSSSEPWLEGQVSLLDEAYQGSQPVSISGQVELTPVRAIQRHEIQRPSFGTEYRLGGASVTPESLGSNGLYLRVSAGADRLVALEALNGQGEPIGSARMTGDVSDEGTRLQIAVSDRPQTLVLHVATDTAEASYPFTIEVD